MRVIKIYKYIQPEVAGGFGNETEIDNSVHPPVVKKLHYNFDGWMGDDILETFPCFIVSERLMYKIIESQLTGVSFDNVKITKSEEFVSFNPNLNLPNFHWMKIYGKLGINDFVIGRDYRLLLSENAMEVISNFNIEYAIFEDYVE